MARKTQALVGINKFTRRRISAYRALTSPAVSNPAGVTETGVLIVVVEAIIITRTTTLTGHANFVTVNFPILGSSLLGPASCAAAPYS